MTAVDNTAYYTEKSLHYFSAFKFKAEDESEIPVLLKMLSNL